MLSLAFTGSAQPQNTTDVDKNSGKQTGSPEKFGGGDHGDDHGGRPRWCKKDYKPCKYQKDHDWQTKFDCCKPDEICLKDKGCRKCRSTDRGPKGRAIVDVDLGQNTKRVYGIDSADACCLACSDDKKCSGFAYKEGKWGKKKKCFLAINDHCKPVEYRESKYKYDTVWTVGGAPCNDYNCKYDGYDEDDKQHSKIANDDGDE